MSDRDCRVLPVFTPEFVSSTKTKIFTTGAILALLVAVAAVLFLTPQRSPRVAKSPSGHVVKLEEWHFQTNRVRYDLPNRPWARRLERWLPNWVNQRIGLVKPATTSIVTPDYPAERLLSAAFCIREPPGTHGIGGLRLVVSDDHGQEFDPAVHQTTIYGGYWVAEMQAFPRRGKELRLRLMDVNTSLGEIKIANPARGPHPRWIPKPLPVSVTGNGLEFSLDGFRSYQPGTNSFTKGGVYPRTQCTFPQCTFHVQENGQDSTSWRPVMFEISDATGNHWRASRDSTLDGVDGKEVSAGFLGALWPEEDAWKLRVEFKRVAEFPEKELLRIEGIPIPGAEEILQPQVAYEINGATVEVSTIIGAQVAYDRVTRLNPDRVRGCFTVLIKGALLSRGRRAVFIEANDERGRIQKLEGAPREPGRSSGQSADFLPYSFNFKAPPDARELTLVLAVSQSRFVEFLAKPEQVREGATAQPN